jgi:outer membrane immunogenic protein
MRVVAIAGSVILASTVSALAADMAVKAPIAAPIAVYNWTGFYVGGNVGYGWGNGDTFFNPLPSAAIFVNLLPQTLSPDPKGVFGGVQAGYNWQSGRFVLGVEADIQAADINGDARVSPIIQNNGTPFPGAGFLSAHQRIDWFGTARVRAGITATDRLLLYVTGGVAFGDVSYAAQTDFRPVGTTLYAAAFSDTKVGWTAGGGAEWAFAPNWSAKVEYLYVDLGNASVVVNPVPPLPPFQVGYTWKTQEHLARVGVNYKWGGPVVAKY